MNPLKMYFLLKRVSISISKCFFHPGSIARSLFVALEQKAWRWSFVVFLPRRCRRCGMGMEGPLTPASLKLGKYNHHVFSEGETTPKWNPFSVFSDQAWKNSVADVFDMGMDFFEQSVRNHGFSPKSRLLRTNHKRTEVFGNFLYTPEHLNDLQKKTPWISCTESRWLEGSYNKGAPVLIISVRICNI